MVCTQEPRGPKPSKPGLLKLQILYQGAEPELYKAANVLHFSWASGANHSSADLATLLPLLRGDINTAFGPSFVGSWSIIGTMLTSLGGDGGFAQETTVTAGTSGGAPNPPQVAVCVSWKSGIIQRGGRGRTYIPGIPVTATTQPGSATIQSAYSGPLHTRMTAFLSAVQTHVVTGDTVDLVIPSYYTKCTLRPTPLVGPVQSLVIHDRLDSQRRRSGKESFFPIS